LTPPPAAHCDERDPGHAALFYRDAAEFSAAARDFVRRSTGGAALVAACPGNLTAMQANLDREAPPPTLAEVSSAGTNPARLFGLVRQFAADHRGQPVSCVQELGWSSRRGSELTEALRNDALIDLALSGSDASVLCAYDARLDQNVLAAVEKLHPVVLADGQWRAGHGYRGTSAGGAATTLGPLSSPPAAAAMLTYRTDQTAVREFTAGQARAAGLSASRVTDLVIAVAELAGNTLDHAPGPGVLTTWVTPEEIICQVEDGGRIDDPLAGTLRPKPESDQRGRGLWVVHQLCDLVEFRTGRAGTVARLHMRRPELSSRAQRRLGSRSSAT